MLRSQRVEAIEQYVYERKKVSLDQLCEAFNVSKNTIRRDIEEIVAPIESAIQAIHLVEAVAPSQQRFDPSSERRKCQFRSIPE